jgi:D-arginine dehydrogenase
MNNSTEYDAVVIGAGVAGISVAALLSDDLRVALLETESAPMVHSTSRSAAMLIENYGGSAMEKYIRGSRRFFVNPPAHFCEAPLASPRGALVLAETGQESALDHLLQSQTGVELLSVADLQQRIAAIRTDKIVGGVLESTAMDLDVEQLCQGYLRVLKRNDGTLVCSAPVVQLNKQHDLWRITTAAGNFSAPIVINAAGAWADEIAEMARHTRIGLVPCRRTAAIVAFEKKPDRYWPMLSNFNETWYARPEGEWMMVSLSEETPVLPCDAWPEDIDVATAIDNFQQLLDMGEVTKLVRSWAGLRTFAPDRHPVVGFDQHADGFFWLAGQGGSGIHSAPALATAAAALITGNSYPEWLNVAPEVIEELSPNRFNRVR